MYQTDEVRNILYSLLNKHFVMAPQKIEIMIQMSFSKNDSTKDFLTKNNVKLKIFLVFKNLSKSITLMRLRKLYLIKTFSFYSILFWSLLNF